MEPTKLMSEPSCPFCSMIQSGDVVIDGNLAAVILDGFPVTIGHSLVIPKRREADFSKLSTDEQSEILSLASERMRQLQSEDPSITGFNLGVNVGASAGQTVKHAHLHVIPRREGDVEDPRGGVRWVMPSKADYWS
jgi:diadenosine tetraphosphate (Ap4A) HIT family hydrolase